MTEQTVAAPDLGRRLFKIGLIAAALAILMFFVHLIIWERQSTAQQVENDIARSWGGLQVVQTPFMVVPYSERRTRDVKQADGTFVAQSYLVTRYLHLAAQDVRINAVLDPQIKRRSLFDVPVYTAAVDTDVRWSGELPASLKLDADGVRWNEARIVFRVAEPRSLARIPLVTIDGRPVDVEPGFPGTDKAEGFLSAPMGLTDAPAADIGVNVALAVKGSRQIGFSATGRNVTASVSSTWPHPSFRNIAPAAATISEDGFTASWSASNLSTGTRLAYMRHDRIDMRAQEIASVALVEPVDLYGQLGRAVKYGVLFIALTFTAYFLFDVIGGRAMPLLGYGLVGLALVQFFLLLTSLSEHISLLPAYVLAAGILTAMITLYTAAVTGNRGRAALLGGIIAILYAGMYALLGLEESALLVGSVMLLAALAALMYATRNIGQEI
ncbi:inner membrane CreD family protein [Pacificimonas sp. WHA3]|uniref:Inner membrane CreD family protein n=1 Tax=Pacificimonas pallii TaxID=2827236 RepID=A0ABS6SDI6_9SPHN|nr:cell envelope integrity protein CreD [Pacificimonas pallii]MBV7256479.1 inner membrane CreD family protein [Pacificimonas pallii]